MSIAIRASTAARRRQRPASVSGNTRTRSPRTVTTSDGRISTCRTTRPTRVRSAEDVGTTTSTGSVGSRSSPNSQAALAPANTASRGSTRRHAESVSQRSSGKPDQRYSPWPMRRQLLPFSCLGVRPARRASAREKGLRLNSAGTKGALPTTGASDFATRLPTYPVNGAFWPKRTSGFGRKVLFAQEAPDQASRRYPTPGSLTMYLGFAGSSPSFLRICATTYRVL